MDMGGFKLHYVAKEHRKTMQKSHAAAIDPPFIISQPVTRTAAAVFSAPHAGRNYAPAFLGQSRLDPLTLRRSEDAFVDLLFKEVVALGAPLMSACFPRAYIDVNREPYELDPHLFGERLPSFANTRSPRVAGGLGTIPRIVGDGHQIYTGKIALEEGLERIDALYKPYHRALRQLMGDTVRQFGYALLVDCHSMPSVTGRTGDAGMPDIVLGDRYGMSAAGPLMDRLEAALRRREYRVVRNRPYAGGYITEHYGEPATGRHAIQIEINRALYMDEATLTPHDGFARLSRDLVAAVGELIEAVPLLLTPRRQAAE